MLAIQVTDWAEGPKPTHTPPPSAPGPDAVQIRVLATGLHQLVRSRATGQHYSSGPLPHTPGVDGTGIEVASGRRVYFTTLGGRSGGGGSFAEIINVPKTNITELPEGVDAVQAAALMNPVMSSWMALRKRVDFLKDGQRDGWSCLIVGATSMSGRLAIKVARSMGATRIVGAARNIDALEQLDLDSHIVLSDNTDFAAAADVDVVLDYLYGPYVRQYLGTTKSAVPVTWVSIGSVAGAEAVLPSAALRSRDLTVRGAGPGAWRLRELKEEIPGMLGMLKGVTMDEVRTVKLADVEAGWKIGGKERVVFVSEGRTTEQ